MKPLLAIVALCAVFLFASSASAQGGSVGKSRAVVKSYTVMKAKAVTEYVPRTRLVWEPVTVHKVSYGSTGKSAAVNYGSHGGAAFGRRPLLAFGARLNAAMWRPVAVATYGSKGR